MLRQLLRGESHTVTYRAGSNAIDRIVLLGDPGTATAATTPPQPPQVQAQPSDAPHGGPSQTAALPQLGPPPAAAEPAPAAAPEPQAAPGAPGEGETAQVNLGDVLRAHAMTAVRAQEHAGQGTGSALAPSGAPASSGPAPSVEETLAQTTRRAQESLKALNSAAGYFRRTLFRNLRLRFAPTILFRLDESLDRGDRIERVLREIHDKERANGAPGEEE